MQILNLPRWVIVIFAIFITLSEIHSHPEQIQPTSDNLKIHHYITKMLHLWKSQGIQSQETALKPQALVLLAGLFCFIAASISSAGGIGGGGLFTPHTNYCGSSRPQNCLKFLSFHRHRRFSCKCYLQFVRLK
ncbi:hypothetical protein SLE2022_014710 [Rubroshorea leprosula]